MANSLVESRILADDKRLAATKTVAELNQDIEDFRIIGRVGTGGCAAICAMLACESVLPGDSWENILAAAGAIALGGLATYSRRRVHVATTLISSMNR